VDKKTTSSNIKYNGTGTISSSNANSGSANQRSKSGQTHGNLNPSKSNSKLVKDGRNSETAVLRSQENISYQSQNQNNQKTILSKTVTGFDTGNGNYNNKYSDKKLTYFPEFQNFIDNNSLSNSKDNPYNTNTSTNMIPNNNINKSFQKASTQSNFNGKLVNCKFSLL
jgi:hypothetical protein